MLLKNTENKDEMRTLLSCDSYLNFICSFLLYYKKKATIIVVKIRKRIKIMLHNLRI